MNTRRDMAIALLGLPLIAKATQSNLEQEPQINSLAGPVTEPPPEQKSESKPIPPPNSVDAVNIISYTLYAEARGESFDGKMAVASVIKTRAIRSKISMAEVCLQSKQFSCWNGLKAVPEFYITGEGIESDDLQARIKCFGIAWVLLMRKRKWDHFTHFYNPDKATPDWAFSLRGTRIIGNHVFGYID